MVVNPDVDSYTKTLNPGTPKRGCITGALPPDLWKGGKRGTGALTYQYHN